MTKFLVATLAILVVFGVYISPLAFSIKQGLDLQGGTHVVMEAVDTPDAQVNEDAMQRAVRVIERRVNDLGLTEPVIQRQGERRIIIELPGEKDPERAIALIGRTALLEFKDESGTTVLTGKDLRDAKAGPDKNNRPSVHLKFSDEGAKAFADLTRKNVGRHIAILLDGKVLTNPVVNEPIPNGEAEITGSPTAADAEQTALLLRSGALPVKLDIVETRTVGPSLGQDSKDKSKVAFAIGTVFIVLFMLAVYRMSGFVANMALLLYVLLLLVALKMLNATLTLPGIAGIILSMGMAVDANILIFERFKEEYRSGKTLRSAMDSGFSRAWATILDSHVTTFVAAAVLFFLGSGPIKGFAITLGLGILFSLFSAITATRFLLKSAMNSGVFKSGKIFGA